MDEPLLDGATVARFDQTKSEATAWAKTLVELRKKLRAGGFSSQQAYRLSSFYFAEHLCHQLSEPAVEDLWDS
jgi:hypothetical protein